MMLQPADILAWRCGPGSNLIERAIGWAEHLIGETCTNGYLYYHVAFVAQDTQRMYSSQPPKIDLYPVPLQLSENVEVYRLIAEPTPEQLQQIEWYGEKRRGRIYPFLGVLTAGWLSGNLEFCSQYTADAFYSAGIALSTDVRFSTPDDIVGSKLLMQVKA